MMSFLKISGWVYLDRNGKIKWEDGFYSLIGPKTEGKSRVEGVCEMFLERF